MWAWAEGEFLKKTPRSKALFERASEVLPGGVVHNVRFFRPHPIYAGQGEGKWLWDVDGNKYTDYWMGHMALLLGHSHPAVAEALRAQAVRGTILGAANEKAVELAERVSAHVPCAGMVRFTTTGAEATANAVKLTRAYTKKRYVIKVEGGWHGFSTALHKGVSQPYEEAESAGLLHEEVAYTLSVPFNDVEASRKAIRRAKDDLAAYFVEPVLGAGGCIPAERDYLAALREELDRVGSLLVFDEIITGFRLGLSGGQGYYRVTPDLCTLGKILGGGMPIGAVAGRREIMKLADPTSVLPKSERCNIGGGTFSGNAISMEAGLAALRFLEEQESKVYEKVNSLGAEVRKRVDRAFAEQGVGSVTTGVGSLFLTHFPRKEGLIRNAADAMACDKGMQRFYHLALMARYSIFFIPKEMGSISVAHDKVDVELLGDATSELAIEARGALARRAQ